MFIDSFQFLSSSLNSLFKNLGEDDFQYLSQKCCSKVFNLVKQKGFSRYEYMSSFKKFNKRLTSKKKFYSSLTGKRNRDKEYEHVLKFWDGLVMGTLKNYLDVYLKCDVL